jgi:TPR repeat protein
MRAALIVAVCLVLCCGFCFAQSDSPQDLYERGLNAMSGSGGSRSDFKALDLDTRAARAGYVPAQVTLGIWYNTGVSPVAIDLGQAAEWYKKAAEQGDSLAQYLLGRLYVLGYAGDSSAGDVWLSKAADAGNPFAAYMLALDLEEDHPEDAMPLFKQAAEQGLPYAQYRLGVGLRDGRGIKQDKFEAYVWLLLSASRVSVASNPLSLLESDLGAAQVQRAKSEARKRDERVRRTVQAGGCTWPGSLNEIPTPPPISVQRFCQGAVKDFEEEERTKE